MSKPVVCDDLNQFDPSNRNGSKADQESMSQLIEDMIRASKEKRGSEHTDPRKTFM